eukprot:Rhum_TRINITY_DN2931_c0_g1::Rhum_TRINITY_DN2931_c0_g1_i1::g.8976::m.8976
MPRIFSVSDDVTWITRNVRKLMTSPSVAAARNLNGCSATAAYRPVSAMLRHSNAMAARARNSTPGGARANWASSTLKLLFWSRYWVSTRFTASVTAAAACKDRPTTPADGSYPQVKAVPEQISTTASTTPPRGASTFRNDDVASTTTGEKALSIWMNPTFRYMYVAVPAVSVAALQMPTGRQCVNHFLLEMSSYTSGLHGAPPKRIAPQDTRLAATMPSPLRVIGYLKSWSDMMFLFRRINVGPAAMYSDTTMSFHHNAFLSMIADITCPFPFLPPSSSTLPVASAAPSIPLLASPNEVQIL